MKFVIALEANTTISVLLVRKRSLPSQTLTAHDLEGKKEGKNREERKERERETKQVQKVIQLVNPLHRAPTSEAPAGFDQPSAELYLHAEYQQFTSLGEDYNSAN